MVEKRSVVFSIIIMIIGVSGLGLGVYSVVRFQVGNGASGKLYNERKSIKSIVSKKSRRW